MEFSQFEEELKEAVFIEVEERLPGTLHFQRVRKGDDLLSGVQYFPGNTPLGLTLYAEEAYEAYNDGLPIDRIAEKMADEMRDFSLRLKKMTEQQEKQTNLEEIITLKKIFPVLIPTKGNEEMLKKVPHIPFENLQVIFKFELPVFCGGGTANVTNEYMEQMGWDAGKMLETALNNPMYKDEIILLPLACAMFGFSGESRDDDISYFKMLPEKLIVITNIKQVYGAAAILDKDVMAKVADVFGENLYIIPSSFHDCILVPEGEMELEELREMLHETNCDKLLPEERLSDDIYYFDSITKEITIASGQREKTKQPGPQLTEPKRR